MTTAPIECQHHRNCGGHCETPEEIEMDLCENCLGDYHDREEEEHLNREARNALQAIAVAAGIELASSAEIARIVCAKLSENVPDQATASTNHSKHDK